ncbi:hypothetical protein HPG69_017786 [Diceros bicornis minor]|uniref:Transducer of regulated CREB activity N-terminal domain-containing protein n=1 Tax=Diceros bicornis minor TaxID=77932 RepID=A0A7J7FGZ2_DICBM|nr:hypothetical protein HPG69_017786 [Diceros bicornis minor]
MAASPGSGSANPRKFSEKIALHTQRQAEETRAFEQLMTDLTLSRVQFQKLQQLRLTQYHGGSLPNVSQLRSSASEFQEFVPPKLHALCRCDFLLSVFDLLTGQLFFPSLCSRHFTRLIACGELAITGWWRGRPGPAFTLFTEGLETSQDDRYPFSLSEESICFEMFETQQPPWKEEKHPGFRLTSALNRTNSDSALHTSALSTKPQDPYGGGSQSAWPAPYMGKTHRPTANSISAFSFCPLGTKRRKA